MQRQGNSYFKLVSNETRLRLKRRQGKIIVYNYCDPKAVQFTNTLVPPRLPHYWDANVLSVKKHCSRLVIICNTTSTLDLGSSADLASFVCFNGHVLIFPASQIFSDLKISTKIECTRPP